MINIVFFARQSTAFIKIRWSSIVVILLAILLYTFISGYFFVMPQEHEYKAYENDKGALETLGDYGLQMIADKAPGVVGLSQQPYIASFEAFCIYVAKKHPEITVSPGAANPFPGFLPSVQYKRLVGTASGPSEVLLETRVYRKALWGHDYQTAIYCGGYFRDLPQ